MRRFAYLIPAALFATLVGYFLVALERDPAVLPSALLERPAPEFALAGLGDRPGFARADLAGGVALVNFFASWCVPCRAEHPMLMRLSNELHVPLYGIDYKDKPEDATRFLNDLGDPYGRIGVDREGRVGIDFGVYGVPETYVIDKGGRIRLRHVGPLTPEALRQEIEPLLRELGRS